MELGRVRAEFQHVAEHGDALPRLPVSAWPSRAIAARIEAGLAL